MHPHRAIHIGVLLAQRFDGSGVLGAHPDTQKMPDTPLPGGLQRRIEGALVGTEVQTIKMAMGIYEHGMTAHMEKTKVSAGARQLDPMGQQGFQQQDTIEVGLGQYFLALFENPRLDLQHPALSALLRQILNHLAHIGQA